jgi:hypothetical protein
MTILLSSFNRGDIAFGVSKPYWAAITPAPFRLKRRDYLLNYHPSAENPWQNTMLGLLCMDVFMSETSLSVPTIIHRLLD